MNSDQALIILNVLGVPAPATLSQNATISVASIKQAVQAKSPSLLGLTAKVSHPIPASAIEVYQWIDWAMLAKSGSKKVDLAALDDILLTKSYLVGQSLTAADAFVFASITAENAAKYQNIARWYEHISRSANQSFFVPKPPTIFHIESKKAEAPAKVEKTEKTTEKAEKAAAEPKKEKKEKKADAAAPAATAAAGEAEKDEDLDPSKLDIKVGLVVKCWNHPESEKLICEEIDLGEGAPRNIASGLRAFYKAEEVQGRKVLVLANLKERPMAGFKSQGMVLCASNADHTQVKLLEVPADAKVGDRVSFPGFHGEPAQPNQVAKKKILEKLAPMLRTDDKGVPHWSQSAFTIGSSVCSSPLPNAIVS